MTERPHDIVAFGATGFTGGLTAEYLSEHAPKGTRWAVAGRNEAKLRAIVDRLAAAPCPPAGHVVARVDDDASLRAMSASTKVLLTTVGPYDEHGGPVVRACVETATDYLDITGEPRFVDTTIDRYHADAKAAGIKVVSCCGFDSIPHDLGVLYTLSHLPAGAPIRVRGFVSIRAGASGGSWHSAVNAMSDMGAYRKERKKRPREAATGGRRVRGDEARVRWVPELRAWAAPMPTIDPQIVLRSAKLCDEYGPDFSYGHYVRIEKLATLVGGGAAIAGVAALAQLKPTRSLLLKWRARGEGPSEAERDRYWFRVTFLGEADGREVVTEVSGGDPGYTETSKMLSESALCLVYDRARCPDRHGVLTTAAAMGQPLIERLQRAGIAFRRVV